MPAPPRRAPNASPGRPAVARRWRGIACRLSALAALASAGVGGATPAVGADPLAMPQIVLPPPRPATAPEAAAPETSDADADVEQSPADAVDLCDPAYRNRPDAPTEEDCARLGRPVPQRPAASGNGIVVREGGTHLRLEPDRRRLLDRAALADRPGAPGLPDPRGVAPAPEPAEPDPRIAPGSGLRLRLSPLP